MSSSQVSRTKKGPNLLSKAGQLSLLTSSRPKILPSVKADEKIAPITDVTTTFLEVQSNSTPVHRSKPTSQVSFSRSSIPQKQANDDEYSRIRADLRNNAKAQAKSVEKNRKERLRHFMEGEEELDGVEQIIGQIQELVSNGLEGEQMQVSFKNRGDRAVRTKKHNWQTKGISSFGNRQQQAFSKLEELLFNYKAEESKVSETYQQTIKGISKEKDSENLGVRQERRRRNKERLERNKKYRQIQQDFSNTSSFNNTPIRKYESKNEGGQKAVVDKSESKQQEPVVPQVPIQEYEQQFSIKEPEQESSSPQKEELLKLQDIQLVELQWEKFPIVLSPLSPDNSQLFLRVRDYPQDQTFLEAIVQTLGQQQQYSSYSIFNAKKTAGLKNGQLLSEEEFRQVWAEEWEHEVEEEESKQMLCQFDFQWYRSLVQLTYSHSLEQMLMKNIKYDGGIYLSNLRKINGGNDDKNKVVDHLNITDRIIVNKLKYIDRLLAKFSKDKNSGKKGNVVVGVVPAISQHQDQQQLVKQEVQKMFIGGLYNIQTDHSMAVVVPLEQGESGKVERVSAGLVRIGQVSMLINNTESQTQGPTISVKYEKLKNSPVKIAIYRPGEEEVILQVGEELHCGRRYKIELD